MNENLEIPNNISQPDPAWDYYIEWHKLIRAKAQLDKLIEFMSKVESATEDSQKILEQDLQAITNTIESI
ncbi:MAG: hypothetical protein V7K48_16750 [Nostoc sp.]|uniref:hypothetical protein n=1 Tax=Nostoc sp. TaxID=1180 RepID=UPI002FF9DDB2